MKYFSYILLLIICVPLVGISQDGSNQKRAERKWKVIEEDSPKIKAIVSIYKKEEKYFGKIVEAFPEEGDIKICLKCKDDRKGQKIKGMEIIRNMEFNPDKNKFDSGTILDPKTGIEYKCEFWVNEEGNLSLRGYVLFFYRTQIWLPHF